MNILADYASKFIGVPYKWGGSTHDGIDCSGLVQEILMSAGLDPSGDQNSQGLFDYFLTKQPVSSVPKAGAICFYGKDVKSITHIAFMIDEKRIIEAGGGGSHVLTREDAEKASAFVRIRPYNHRSDLVAILLPNYPEWINV